jgi:Na+/melibiose symporter-like transporter
VASVFAGTYFIAMTVLAFIIRERAPNRRSPPPLFPAALHALTFNQPLRRMLTPGLLDTAIEYIVFPFLPFYVLYVLNPYDKCEMEEYYESVKCKSTYWIGFLTVSYLIGALVAQIVWKVGIRVTEKKFAWMICSIMQSVCFPALLLCLDKYMIVAMIVFCAIGFAQSGNFIKRCLLADIIDYEEFIQQRRIEGTLTGYIIRPLLISLLSSSIFEGLGKFTIVVVHIIPLTFLYISGYNSPDNGVPQDQDQPAKIYLQCVLQLMHHHSYTSLSLPCSPSLASSPSASFRNGRIRTWRIRSW